MRSFSARLAFFFVLVCVFAALASANAAGPIPTLPKPDQSWRAVPLGSLDLSKMSQDYGTPHINKSITGVGLSIGGEKYATGVGSHASSEVTFDLNGKAKLFEAMVGVDDDSGTQGSVVFSIMVDGKTVAKTPVMRGGDKPIQIGADLEGAKMIALSVEDGGDDISFDHADWADALFFLGAGAPDSDLPRQTSGIDETPMGIAHADPNLLSINGPRIVGSTPGKPFLFLIPATGKAPLKYAAKGLPEGLSLDADTGIISGSLAQYGKWEVALTVRDAAGSVSRGLTIVGDKDKLALTPPMGWNSWYCWAGAIDQQKMADAADVMIKTGLAAHGYQYVNIDDCWEGTRDANGEIMTNSKFPDMKKLGDYIHSKGLKFGIYTSPGPKTCGGYTGSYQHEVSDARTYSRWGVDFVKHDWCSYGGIAKDHSLPELKKPYAIMHLAMNGCDRDMVYSLCQYGMGNVWEWGETVGGNMWRTDGDLADSYAGMVRVGFRHAGREKYVGPGHWNDPDMLCVGKVGFGNLRPSRLTQNEQITQVTLWSLIAAPLLIGGDIMNMDQFTVDVLSNDDVLAVDQDPLGKAAGRIAKTDSIQVWARPLSDGTMAVGLFNTGRGKAKVTVNWSDLGLSGPQPVRDLWRRKDVGTHDKSFTAEVLPHAAWLVKVGKAQ